MTEFENLLKTHDWSLQGCFLRPALDQAMRNTPEPEATALWEQYCPWSNTNGGYVAWSKK